MHFVVDIDSTLANISHRLPLVERTKPDWNAFLAPELVARDLPIPEAFLALRRIRRAGASITYLTGRSESLRRVTTTWLLAHGAPAGRLMMRLDGDLRGATAVKTEHLKCLVAAKPTESLVLVDDDLRVLAAVAALDRRVLPILAPECWPFLYPECAHKDDPAWRR